MAKQFDALDEPLTEFIRQQHIFFTASATDTSRVNVTPREIGALRVIAPNTVIYLDRTGSGNETAAHMLKDGRMTIMLCAFAGPPRIMRLYGKGTALGWETRRFRELISEHYKDIAPLGTRQIMHLDIDLVQTSCGYGVPLFDYQGEREAIENWHNSKGEDGIKDYWEAENLSSMDGLPTGLTLPK